MLADLKTGFDSLTMNEELMICLLEGTCIHPFSLAVYHKNYSVFMRM